MSRHTLLRLLAILLLLVLAACGGNEDMSGTDGEPGIDAAVDDGADTTGQDAPAPLSDAPEATLDAFEDSESTDIFGGDATAEATDDSFDEAEELLGEDG